MKRVQNKLVEIDRYLKMWNIFALHYKQEKPLALSLCD